MKKKVSCEVSLFGKGFRWGIGFWTASLAVTALSHLVYLAATNAWALLGY